MSLPLAFVFHFNQHTNEYADIANRVCYRGLLGVLRAHPKLKFNLHLSGTLLRTLPWFDEGTLDLVRAGLADGQFELLGSTYAQNVPYASDDWDNAQQVRLHRDVLQQMFGVSPTVFWIAERCWRQSLLPLIAEGGYSATLIEDHILHAAGLDDPVPVTTRHGEHALTAVYDDTILRTRLNYAAWFGRRAQLFKYLQQLAERPGSERFLLAYAEDAEALGLWGWEKGYLPNATWAHLDALLSELEQSGAYRLVHVSEAKARDEIGFLPDGAAEWMDRALRTPDAPYHEDGYTDWFDFLTRSPKLAYFRRLSSVLRQRVQPLAEPAAKAGGTALAFYNKAVEAFCHHQYEYGCIGVGGRGYWGWENIRSAFMFARAAEIALDPPNLTQWIEDVNGDGSDEQVLFNGRELAVFTAYGARLIYWLDVHSGAVWVGNHLAVPAARYASGATKIPHPVARREAWLPEAYEATLKGAQSLRQKEPPPTAMGRHLPEWIFEGDGSDLTVYKYPTEPAPPTREPLNAQTGALAQVVRVDGQGEDAADDLHDYRFQGGGQAYLLFPAPDVVIEKHVTQADGAVIARYVIDNRDEVVHRVQIESYSELCPDYARALPHGRAAYAYELHQGQYPAVRNTLTGTVLALEASRPFASAECAPNLLAVQVRLALEVEVAPRSQEVLEIRLSRYAGEPGAGPAG